MARLYTAAIGHNPGMRQPLFQVRDLCKNYGTNTVVDQLSFHIDPGECLGVIGPNGAGKTTTIRMCLGQTTPDQGEILFRHEPAAPALFMPGDALEIKARLGVVTQFDTLDPDFSCAENLLVYGRYFGLAKAEIAPRVPLLLDFAALKAKADAKPGELSGGMRRRLSLARALVNNPQLLLLDEPTTGLDPQARHLIWERLRRLTAEGTTILLTTHFMDEAERLANRLAIMDAGRILAQGSPREVIAAHIEPQVVEIFGEWQGEGAAAWAAAHAHALCQRCEVSGETAFCYTTDAAPLLAHLAHQPGLRSLHRPANLEDVFLKLTGRDLRD